MSQLENTIFIDCFAIQNNDFNNNKKDFDVTNTITIKKINDDNPSELQLPPKVSESPIIFRREV